MTSCTKEFSPHLFQTCISATLRSKLLTYLLTLTKTSKVQLAARVSIMKLKTKIVSLGLRLTAVLEQGPQKKRIKLSIITVLLK